MLSRIDIVIEAVFDSRADAEFHTGIEFLKSFRKKVSRAMPERMLAFGIFPFEEFNLCISVYWTGKIPLLTIDRSSQNILSQTRTDRFGNLKRSHTGLKLLYAFIGECYIYHYVIYY